MKVSIIGTNKKAGDFIQNCTIVDNYKEADVIIFAGNLNWRSAVQKFHNIEKNKLVIAMNSAIKLFVQKYGGTLDTCFLNRTKCTVPILLKEIGIQTEGLLDACNLIYAENERRYVESDVVYTFKLREYMVRKMKNYPSFEQHTCGIVSMLKQENMPDCLIIQLDLNTVRKPVLIDYLNKIICDYTNLQ